LSITKRFSEIPFAHRQPLHEGHCSLIHGRNWSFEFEIGLKPGHGLDQNGFIVDFGELKPVRKFLEDTFDHALVLSFDDPVKGAVQAFARIVELETASAEGIAEYVTAVVVAILGDKHPSARLLRTTVFEDSRNSAT